ncbi:amino acid adenylation domain-containing protein [Sorangium sp. So ce542]|uniref:amino acid adenylation domain-containing protein n=1 Tax=Sorangium sp. So ce542 TaxID=3133316 RepID=UPI003F5E756C
MTPPGHDARRSAPREALGAPSDIASLPELLARRAEERGGAPAYLYLQEGEAETSTLTFDALYARARAIAAFLRRRYPPRSRVLLLFAPGLEFIEAFFGCLWAEMVAVPTSLPRPNQAESRFDAIAADCTPACALTGGHALRERSRSTSRAGVPVHALGEIPQEDAQAVGLPRWAPGDVAYLQYTSGSTSSPKGVMVSHHNALQNCRMLAAGFGLEEGDTFVTWLPHFHDMGLVYGLVIPLFLGGRCYVMPPAAFLFRPLRWLEAISRYRAHHSAAPNFAFDLCVASSTPEQRASLDLSSWKTVINGAEPVRARTLARFVDAFAPCGLRPDVLRPAYGLAEATLGVSCVPRRPSPRVLSVSAAELQQGRVRACPPADPDAQELVSCGAPMPGVRVAIVDPSSGEPAPERQVGEVWVAGDAVVSGYFQNEQATGESFGARLRGGDGPPFLRTGDLGILHEGELFVTGRIKDIIIVRGRNYYPQDIEVAVAGAHEAFAPDGGAAFPVSPEDGIPLPADEPEALVVCQELKRGQRGLDLEELARAARRAVAQQFGLPVAAVVLLGPRRIPKTTSGKIQRRACKAAFLRGELETLGVFHDERGRDGEPGAALAHGGLPEDSAARGDRASSIPRLEALARDVLQVEATPLRWDVPLVEYGLDSLKAVQLANRLARLSGAQISPVRLFEGMTLAELQALLDQHGAPDGHAAAISSAAPDRGDPRAPFPLTEVQRAYLLGREESLDLGGVGCHAYLELERDELDLDRFERAWNRVIERHDMLRAVFSADGLQRVQRAAPAFQLKVWDHRAETPAGAERAVEEVRSRLSHRVFAPDAWPLFDVGVSLLPGGRCRVHLNVDLLALDAWSVGILSRDLELLYEQPERRLPPLGVTFRDCVLDDVRHRQTAAYERSLTYWRERMASLPPAPELPLAQSPRDVTPPRFARRRGRLARAAWEQIKERARAHRLTPSGVVLAAFAQVIGKWSARPDFALTLTSFERPPLHEDVYGVVGDFTTVALLGFDVDRHRPFCEVARAAQDQIWGALEHRRVGAIPALRERRAPNVPVVFTSMLGQGGPGSRAPFAWLGEEIAGISQTPQVWFDHQVVEDRGDLTFSWDVVDALFPEGMVDAMLESYRDLLAELSRSDAAWRRAAQVALPPAQRAVREAVNRTRSAGPEELLHTMFARSAANDPAAPAVIAPEGIMTFGELDRRSNALGRALRARGARPNALVAIATEKCGAQALGVLGILKSGAAYLPVDPTWPRERVWRILEQGEVQIVLTQARFAEPTRWPAGVVVLPIDAPDGWSEDASPLDVVQGPDDLAYVIFTSGSTGTPKGVAIEHRGAANTIDDVNARLGVRASDRILSLSSLTFDLSVYDLFGMWAAGGAVVLPRPARTRDPGHWHEMMTRHGVTLWNTVPALMQMLVEDRALRADTSAPLRAVLLSGDWIPVSLPDRVREVFPGARVLSLGGATEASIWSIAYPIERVDPGWKSIPYGKPLANQRFYVLDRCMEACPDWVPGRLYIGGVGLAREYWRDEERTRERFVTHPGTGERLYWTGDLGRALPDGTIEFLGREDLQVKIQGHRIELEEIEATLLKAPGVGSAAAAVGSTASGGKRLLAFVAPAPGQAVDLAALRGFVASKLPDYMVPSALIQLPRLPLTSNGKVDRGALTEPASERSPEALLRAHARVRDVRLERATDGSGAWLAYVVARESGPAPAAPPLVDPLEKALHKLSKPALRDDLAEAAIPLGSGRPADDRLSAFARRRSYRQFRDEPVAFERLAGMLAQLAQVRLPGYPIPKQAYASAGGLYPVQVYLYAKPGRIERVPGGTFYHHPERHELVPIEIGAHIDGSAHAGPNAQAFESSAFSVFLVADLGAIEPVYGALARDFCLMEAGIIAHLLESSAPDQSLGLCQMGGFDFAPVARLFKAGPRHEYLHGLVGGAISPADTTIDALARESEALRAMIDLATRVAAERPARPAAPPERSPEQLERELSAYLAERWQEPPIRVIVVDRLPGSPPPARAPAHRARAESGSPAGAPVAEDDALEGAIARIWAEALKRPAVGRDDKFFELGGDSLLLVGVARAIRERLGYDVALVHLFEHPTVARQAAYLRTLASRAPRPAGGGAGEPAAPRTAEDARLDAVAERAQRQRERGLGRRALADGQAARRDRQEG